MAAVQIDAPQAVRTGEPLTLFNAAIIINNVYQQNLEPTQGGYIPKRIANKLRQQLKGQELLSADGIDARLELMLAALQELNVLQLTPQVFQKEKPMYEPGPVMEVWSRLEMVWQARQLLTRWAASAYWPGVTGVNFQAPSDYTYNLNPKAGRGVLLQYLADSTQEHVWYDISSILKDLYKLQPGVMRSSYGYLTKKQRDDFTKNPKQWMQTEGEIYIGMIGGVLFEMGVVDLGYEQTIPGLDGKTSINPTAMRLNEFGKQVIKALPNNEKDIRQAAEELLRGIAAAAAEPARKFIVQPNFELLLLEPDMPALYSVLPFVQVKQIGHSSTLQLTQNALLRGMRSGLSVDTIIQTLQTRCKNELPQNVAYSLRDWAKQYREAVISQVYLIEVPAMLTEALVAHEKLQKQGVRQVAPGILAVGADCDLNTLKNILEKEKIVVHTKGNFFVVEESDDNDYDDYYRYR
jgi:XPB/Ssl2-like helicase family protein